LDDTVDDTVDDTQHTREPETSLLEQCNEILEQGGFYLQEIAPNGACFMSCCVLANEPEVTKQFLPSTILRFKKKAFDLVEKRAECDNVIVNYNCEVASTNTGSAPGSNEYQVKLWRTLRTRVCVHGTYFPVSMVPYIEEVFQMTIIIIDSALSDKDQPPVCLGAGLAHSQYEPNLEDREFVFMAYTSQDEGAHYDLFCRLEGVNSRCRYSDLSHEIKAMLHNPKYTQPPVRKLLSGLNSV